jgi:phytoene dehydrogenase-like protein
MLDAVVVGAGPNGLTAAAELARRGFSVEVFEAQEAVGGGARTEELTLPGFRHDPCSAVHPLGIGSPAFAGMPLARHGLEWLQPELSLAHPFPDGSAAVLTGSVGESAMSLGAQDAGAYRRLLAPYLGHWDTLAEDFLRTPWIGLPRDPYRWVRFGLDAIQPATLLARRFRGAKARGLFAGLAAHAIAPTSGLATGGIALLFAVAAHENGWPVPRGGSQAISDALASYVRELGGTIRTGMEVKRLDELPPARAYVFDTSPTALARIAGLGQAYRGYRYGASCFKIDYALSGPVPWTAKEARRAGTVHIGPDRQRDAGSRGGPRPERAVSDHRTAQPGRPIPRTRGPSRLLGVRTCPGGLGGRCHRGHRAAAGAVRPRLPRSGARPRRRGPAATRRAQRPLRRR